MPSEPSHAERDGDVTLERQEVRHALTPTTDDELEELFLTYDHREGVAAFLDERQPEFRSR